MGSASVEMTVGWKGSASVEMTVGWKDSASVEMTQRRSLAV